MAALITDSLKVDAGIEPGGRGEFTIWVGGVKVAEKSRHGFPSDKAILDSVSKAISA
ncbi:MAG: hypothetical protein K2Y23_26645 [Cyanobacteria bacterium]|nr:hypothetical protein [Cyanobacteriota bacterium]